MRILAGIPTRGRTTAPALARQLAEYAADVLIIYKDIDLPSSPDYRLIQQPGGGLSWARNFVFRVGIAGSYDAIIQCDDDVVVKPEVLGSLVSHAEELFPKGIASVMTRTRIFEFWDGPCRSNKSYEIVPRLFQLYAIRTDIVRELGLFDLDTCEDLEYACRMISKGYIPTQIAEKGVHHNISIPRLKKGENQGGQPVAERMSLLDKSLAAINRRYDFVTCSRRGESSLSNKFNYRKVRELIPDLGLGYEDKRGIRA